MSTTPSEAGDAAALAAIRSALANARSLSAEEEREFFQFRSTARVRRIETLCRERRGRLIFRLIGRGGADLPCHPIEWSNRQALRKFQRTLGRIFRQPPSPTRGVQSR